MKNKYVIVSLKAYNGGPIVLHSLCRYLCELGCDAKIFYINNIEKLKNKGHGFLISCLIYTIRTYIKNVLVKFFGEKHFNLTVDMVMKCKRKILPFVGKDTIVIYPEIIFGNPLRAKKVVRWFLYYNSFYKTEGNKTIGYDKDDMFVTYRDVFNDKSLNPTGRKLHTPYFNFDLYKRTNYGDRTGKCYIIRKGVNRTDLPTEFDGIIIDDLSENEKVEVFNKCEYCISYDTQTAYSEIAAMCGCISIVVPEEGKSKEDYISSEDSDFGKAYGFGKQEIEYAKNTAHKVKGLYEKLNQKSVDSVKCFLNECDRYFK